MGFDFNSLVGLAGNAATGGILGAVGSIGTGLVSIWQAKSQYAHEEAIAALEIQRIGANSEAQLKLATANLKLTEEQGANASFQASQAAASSVNNLPSWAAAILAFVRPAALLALTSFSAWLYPRSDAATQTYITQVCLTSWAMALGWYFGNRQMLQFMPSKSSQ